MTTARVLTMAFEEGCSITDVESIESMGLCRTDVARLLSECFCRQIFLHGFVLYRLLIDSLFY
jgi:predicted unusual protein kinase regulating ubiquinone biosynthesis (AarF/ABC1/UbiB family)